MPPELKMRKHRQLTAAGTAALVLSRGGQARLGYLAGEIGRAVTVLQCLLQSSRSHPAYLPRCAKPLHPLPAVPVNNQHDTP